MTATQTWLTGTSHARLSKSDFLSWCGKDQEGKASNYDIAKSQDIQILEKSRLNGHFTEVQSCITDAKISVRFKGQFSSWKVYLLLSKSGK